MKNLTHIIMFSALSSTMFLSCTEDFLDKPAYSALSDEVLADEKGVNTLLIGAYAALDGVGTGDPWAAQPSNWVYGDVTGGDAHKGSEASDQSLINSIANFNSSPSNEYFNTKWKALYEGITRANSVLRLLELVEEISETERANLMGQARFLRGHYYFELKKMFNMVPWVDETTEDV